MTAELDQREAEQSQNAKPVTPGTIDPRRRQNLLSVFPPPPEPVLMIFARRDRLMLDFADWDRDMLMLLSVDCIACGPTRQDQECRTHDIALDEIAKQPRGEQVIAALWTLTHHLDDTGRRFK